MVDSYNATTEHYEVEYEPVVRPTGYIDLDAANTTVIPAKPDTSRNTYDHDQLMADMAEHEEDVWDDSALIEAWDAAVNEYQTYHAKGDEQTAKKPTKRKLKPIPKKYQAKPASNLSQPSVTSTTNIATSTEQQSYNNNDKYDSTAYNPQVTTNETNHYSAEAYPSYPSMPFDPASHPTWPQDPDTMNMVMAWYYAGYYTAIHQAKQQTLESRVEQKDINDPLDHPQD
ncbi:hypothetical protein BDF22DRAFT_656578 [Syncephalis plumigaleata]|nr:hypothetical protein BDF22DRAFT_656578 [Syncephalis plumigaleata]